MPFRNARAPRQCFHGKIRIEVSHDPRYQFRKTIRRLRIVRRRFGKLFGVATLQRSDKFLRSCDGDVASIIFFDQCERQIDAGSETGRRVEWAVFNDESFVIDAQFWKTTRDIGSEA